MRGTTERMYLGVNGRFLAARAVTGVQRFALELLRALDSQADVTLFLPTNASAPEGFAGRVLRGYGRGHLWEQVELPRMAGQARAPVLLHPGNTAPLSAHRSVVVVHDPFPLTNPEWFTRRYALWQQLVVAPAQRRTTRILTVSEWSRDRLAQALRVPREKIGVVPQGIAPFDSPAPPSEVERVRQRHGLPQKYLIAFGGRDPRKNIRFLVPVMEELSRIRPNAHLVVVGDVQRRVHPPDAEVRAGVNMQILGQLAPSDAHALLTGASAMCLPSLAEGFGRPPLEALACGVPAVVGPYPTATEVLGTAGTILPWDATAWATTLHALLDDPRGREKAFSQAEPLKRRFTWAAAADVVIGACQQASGQHGSAQQIEAACRAP